MYVGVGSGGRLRKVPESSGVKWCISSGSKFPEGSGRFRRVLVYAGVGSGGGGFRKVPKGWFQKVLQVGVSSRGRVRKVPEGSEEFRRVLVEGSGEFRWFLRQVPEISGRFRCVLV